MSFKQLLLQSQNFLHESLALFGLEAMQTACLKYKWLFELWRCFVCGSKESFNLFFLIL